MASIKRLSSVCHSTAHHAVSGLSYVHPHVLLACKEAGLDKLEIDLLSADPCPSIFRENEPLYKSLFVLQRKFFNILGSEGLSVSALSKAQLEFRQDTYRSSNYCAVCRVTLVSKAGRIYEKAVNYFGNVVA